MTKVLSIILSILILTMSAGVCLSQDETKTTSGIPNYTQEQEPQIIEGESLINLNDEPNGKELTPVEQERIKRDTVVTNIQGQQGN